MTLVKKDINRIKLLIDYSSDETLGENLKRISYSLLLEEENYPYDQLKNNPTPEFIAKIIKEANGGAFLNDKEAWAEAAFYAIKDVKTHDRVRQILMPDLKNKRVIDYLRWYMNDDEFKRKYHVKPIAQHEQYLLALEKEGGRSYEQRLAQQKKLAAQYITQQGEDLSNYVWDPNANRPQGIYNANDPYIPGNYVPLTPENVDLRGVPFGFHPDEYPEYLRKKKEIENRWPAGEMRDNRLGLLNMEYFHKDFPFGITKDAYKDYYEVKNKLKKEEQIKLQNYMKGYKSPVNTLVGNDYFATLKAKQMKDAQRITGKIDQGSGNPDLDFQMGYSKIKSEFKNLNEWIDAVFEYNPVAFSEQNKSKFQKWWDSYGIWAEFGFWIIVDSLTEGWALRLAQNRQGKVLSKIVLILGRSGLPVASGVFRSVHEGNLTTDAVIDFCFAVIPWAHSYFGMVKAPSKEIVEQIIIKRQGLNLGKIEDCKKYVRLLTNEERRVFQDFAKLTPEELNSAVGKTFNAIRPISQKYEKTIGKGIKQTVGKRSSDFVKRVVFIDLPAIEVSKMIVKSFGLLDDEEKSKAIEQFFKNKPKGEDLVKATAAAISILQNPEYENLKKDELIKKLTKESDMEIEEAIRLISESQFKELLITGDGTEVEFED